MNHKRESGFTLIELLVVIAIIGLLASIIMASVSTVRARGRDARRMADIDAIRKALVLYADDNHNIYPIAIASTTLTGADAVSTALIASSTITSVPKDPSSPASDYVYWTDATGANYTISFCLETDAISGRTAGCENVVTQ